jgi:hypothetical protein
MAVVMQAVDELSLRLRCWFKRAMKPGSLPEGECGRERRYRLATQEWGEGEKMEIDPNTK